VLPELAGDQVVAGMVLKLVAGRTHVAGVFGGARWRIAVEAWIEVGAAGRGEGNVGDAVEGDVDCVEVLAGVLVLAVGLEGGRIRMLGSSGEKGSPC
jgi:hypothetical protein